MNHVNENRVVKALEGIAETLKLMYDKENPIQTSIKEPILEVDHHAILMSMLDEVGEMVNNQYDKKDRVAVMEKFILEDNVIDLMNNAGVIYSDIHIYSNQPFGMVNYAIHTREAGL